MTTKVDAKRTLQRIVRLPDPPDKSEDELMTLIQQFAETGNMYHLKVYLGNPQTTLVTGDRSLYGYPGGPRRAPDAMVAFGVDVAMFEARNAYVISEQGKPPDFVLEVASRSTGKLDVTEKLRDYEALKIPEYWTFDRTGRYHGVKLGGWRLVGGLYVSIPIVKLAEDVLQGWSEALGLYLRWDHGTLFFIDPDTGLPIDTLLDARERERQSMERERQAMERERQAMERECQAVERGNQAMERERRERGGRLAAESRVLELEAELEHYRGTR